MLNIFKEFEQVYCLEVPKGIPVIIDYHGTKGMNSMGIYNSKFDDKLRVLFDENELHNKLEAFGLENILIYGIINGPNLTFSVIDVKLDSDWITVPLANEMSKFLKFSFVPYSVVTPKEAEFQKGVILKPIQECVDEDGKRIIQEIK